MNRSLVSLFFKFVIIAMMSIVVGCGQGEEQFMSEEDEWETGHGELPNSIRSSENFDLNMDKDILDFLYQFNEEYWGRTEYEQATGEWFFQDGIGSLGYGLSNGIHRKEEEIFVSFITHNDESIFLDRNVRIQLTERDGQLEKKDEIVNETIYIDEVNGDHTIYTALLPEKENTFYLLSVEIINNEGVVEDTRVSSIYVPVPEINATLETEKEIYGSSTSEITLLLQNHGPTILFFGTYYTIEKKIDGAWHKVPLDIAFPDIGITLSVNDTYTENVDISTLEQGKYRVVKEIQADGLSLDTVLAAEFTRE
ncbi:immunoglobulin-like domain-containing protein [Evansella tamaricis]|uniref:Bacterial Ig-like domain-containing protein n=1 Tax=Evansella tamaricis TaxID=2069301 RepID=A0ABS6JLZ3_9BACI|nr:immunoglobulin-like domain-containing protein [Evansella tamaricis]MBU9713872.1 hypothetical protein [Evansella tamaricis]